MAFERFEKQTHTVAEVIVYVSYDRFTTRFEIKTEYEVIYSSLVLFFIKKSKLSINGKSFVLKIDKGVRVNLVSNSDYPWVSMGKISFPL